MRSMINLTIQTEFNFKNTYGKIEDVIGLTNGQKAVGVADPNNTFAHIYLEKQCQKFSIKPIFGVRLMVVDRPEEKVRSRFGPEYIFIAKNIDGFKEINELVKTSYDKFYYKAMISTEDMLGVSANVFVICECPQTFERLDYIGLSPSTPRMMLDFDVPKVAIQKNRYFRPEEKEIYQLLAGARKSGTGWNFLFNSQTYPQHIVTTEEWFQIWKDEEAINNTHIIAEQCEVEIPRASMVKYNGKKTIEAECIKGALKLGIDLDLEPYKSRYEREIKLIKEKEYPDYFMIVAEMIAKAKKTMLVGPARGSSAGSLVCYLMGITTVDPIPHGLIFERFIDINRMDLPDIDVDFPDVKRQSVIKNLIKDYKANNVCHISNINRMGAKSTIGEIAMALSIPKWEVDLVKESIVDRSGGDARAAMAAADTLNTTDVGKEFLKKYPAVARIEDIEGHATHAGKHAAGIIVCNDEITDFGGVNSREGTIMMDKKSAEAKNLLKIDALGLRTLSILEECADQIGMKYEEYYSLPLDDEKTFQIFKDMRLSGIFQFEGRAMQMLCKNMGCEHFNDIVALTALARPGPLHSGAAAKFISRRTGVEPIEFVCQHESYINETKDTMGVIVYQEQLMNLCRNCGNMSWEDVSEIRKAASKTLGKEFFNQYREKFMKGAKENQIDDQEAVEMWENMMTFGSWGMNLSHSVSYGYISYWCAYMKANHPAEYTVANLNHSSSEESAIRILRDATENDGLEYVPVDPDESGLKWIAKGNVLIGGLTNIKGIAEAKAKEIIAKRKTGGAPSPSLVAKLLNPKTPYDILYPCEHYYGDYYKNYQSYGIPFPLTVANNIEDEGDYILLGRVVKKDLRDLNEYNEVVKRNGVVWNTNNKDLRLVVEDDTNQILCKITRFDFDRMGGQSIYESINEGKSYVIIRGTVKKGWRMIYIKAFYNIGVPDED